MPIQHFTEESVEGATLKLPLAVGFGTMVLAAHISGINAAFPEIIRGLGSDVGRAQWILTAYTLALSACLLTFGALAARIGLRTVYVIGMVVYGCVSMACALASETTSLIWLRCTQGIGAAMMSATSVAMLCCAHVSS
jgi:DHA2 family methylenomycin A resistance protein-like MFS transporter